MQPDIICGANAVAALFRRRPDDVLRLFYATNMRLTAGPYCAILAKRHAPYRELPPPDLEKAAGTAHHGGIAAVAKPRDLPFVDIEKPPRVKLLLVLDGIGNPHNLGAIARSAAFFGVTAMLLHEHEGAAMLSGAVYRTAEGALEHMDVFRTRDLARALYGLTPHFRIAAATLSPDATPFDALPRDRNLALVLGHEERGVSAPVLAACRRQVRIPGSGLVQSLNVAQAASVMLHTLTQGRPATPIPDTA
jgi:TrmH RNA methyltransferase